MLEAANRPNIKDEGQGLLWENSLNNLYVWGTSPSPFLSGLVAGDSAICGRLATLNPPNSAIAACGFAIWGDQTTSNVGAGWACDSQIAAG